MTSLRTQTERTQPGARASAVSTLLQLDSSQPSFPVAVAPAAPVIKLGRNDLVVADTAELRSLITARSAHVTFDKQTGAHGETSRGPVHRLIDDYGRGGFLATVTGFGGSVIAGIAAAVFTDGLAAPILALGAGGSIITLVVGIAACVGATDLEHKILRKRPLPANALEPLQRIFDAPEASQLERAVVAKLAERYARDLEQRKVRGEVARTVLRDIARQASEIDPATKASAGALVECFALIHDDRGRLVTSLGAGTANTLETALACMAPHDAEKIRPALLKLLYVGDTARPEMPYEAEARLYRVLTGTEPARIR